ncbi:hypothetical protein HDU79_004195 [Rhizoclosmatium sp. JEL0117]|nr:hypothetical protein HDU79_004195 [Rhizoclosmatium sp. JEL0117]
MTSLLGPFPIQVFSDQQSGRYAVASKDIPAGSLVLRGKAFGIECCSACFNAYTLTSSLPLSCPTCSSVYYCSQSCLQSHSPLHTHYECPRFKELNSIPSSTSAFDKLLASIDRTLESDPRTVSLGAGSTNDLSSLMESCYDRNDIMSMARWILNFCIRVEIEREFGSRPEDDVPSHKDYLELVPNDECLSPAERIQFHGLYHLFAGIKKEKGNMRKPFSQLFQEVFPSVQEFVTVINIRQCNGFGLWDGEAECMGNAVYPAASFFNHSCEKNLERELGMRRVGGDDSGADAGVIVESLDSLQLDESVGSEEERKKREIWKALDLQVGNVLYAKRDIKKGEWLTHSYVDGDLEREIRRKGLKDVYYFDCRCEKCERGE